MEEVKIKQPHDYREQYKQGILNCLKDIENNIEDILDRIMTGCCGASIEIIIEPNKIVKYIEKHEHFPRIPVYLPEEGE